MANKKTSTKKATVKKEEPKKPSLPKIEFKEKVTVGSSVTIDSKHYKVLEGNKLKSKTSGEVFTY